MWSPALEELMGADLDSRKPEPIFNSRQARDFAVSVLDGVNAIPRGLVDTHNMLSPEDKQIHNYFADWQPYIKDMHTDQFKSADISRPESFVHNVGFYAPQILAAFATRGASIPMTLGRRVPVSASFVPRAAILDALINAGQDDNPWQTVTNSLTGGLGRTLKPLSQTVGLIDSQNLAGKDGINSYNRWTQQY